MIISRGKKNLISSGKKSRTANVKRNLFVVILTNGASIILTFAVRTAILKIMGEQYVGLSSLFSSIFQVLNLAELGFSSAVVYNMYKPLAEHDVEQVCKLLNYYRKVYKLIGVVILTLGFLLMPFIPRLIHGTLPEEINIYLLYAVCLSETSMSYLLFGYKSSLIEATQRMDIFKLINFCVHFVVYLVQIIVLIVTHNYYYFALISVFGTLAISITISQITKKMYPEYKACGVLSKIDKHEIGKRVKGLVFERMTSVARDSFDSVILSAQLGLTIVGIYNNYLFISTGVFTAINLLCQSMQASIGNSIAVESVNKNYLDYRRIHFIFIWILTWASACLLCLYQPFMKVWAGVDLMLSTSDMMLCVVFFYVRALSSITMLYFRGNGLWWKLKRFYVIETFSNLILNIVLGSLFGVGGIITSSIITQCFLRIIPTAVVLFKEYFKEDFRSFVLDVISYIMFGFISCAISYLICIIVEKNTNVNIIISDILICLFLPNLVFLVLNYRRDIFKDSCKMVKAHMRIR